MVNTTATASAVRALADYANLNFPIYLDVLVLFVCRLSDVFNRIYVVVDEETRVIQAFKMSFSFF